MTPEQKIDDLENRDIKNLVAAVRETSAMGREAEELLNKCRERKHEIAEKFIDQEALVAELQARVNYLEVYKVGPSRRLEKPTGKSFSVKYLTGKKARGCSRLKSRGPRFLTGLFLRLTY